MAAFLLGSKGVWMGSMQSTADRWTVQQILQWSQEYLTKQGLSDSPRLDCELLLAHGLGWDRLQLYLRLSEEVPEGVRAEYRNLLKRRASGEPVAYLVGYRDFWKERFTVTPDVLIPRPDTETLVEAALEMIQAAAPSEAPLRILDVGTGSGCIALSVFLDSPRELAVTGWDISQGALTVARTNAARLVPQKAAHRLHWVHCDARERFRAGEPQDSTATNGGDHRYRIIVSNPPYIAHSEGEQLGKSVMEFEPHSALFAEDEGLAFYHLLAQGAGIHLERGGVLLVEVGATQAPAVREIFAAQGWSFLRAHRDLARKERVLGFVHGSREDLALWVQVEELESPVTRRESMVGQTLSYASLETPQPLAHQDPRQTREKKVVDPSKAQNTDTKKPSLSKQATFEDVYYEEASLSDEEEKLLALYGAED